MIACGRISTVLILSCFMFCRAHLVDQVVHSSSSCGIASRQEAENVGRVCDTLNSQAANSSDASSDGVEEDGAFRVRFANISRLSSATRPDDGDWTAWSAISQLVVGVAVVLAFGEIMLLDILGLNLCSIFLDGKIRVDKICDGEADASLRCWCSEGGGKKSRQGEQGTSAGLHLERLLMGVLEKRKEVGCCVRVNVDLLLFTRHKTRQKCPTFCTAPSNLVPTSR